jgi:hypothetical protein
MLYGSSRIAVPARRPANVVWPDRVPGITTTSSSFTSKWLCPAPVADDDVLYRLVKELTGLTDRSPSTPILYTGRLSAGKGPQIRGYADQPCTVDHAPVGSLKTPGSLFAHVPRAKRGAPTRENDVSSFRPGVISCDPSPGCGGRARQRRAKDSRNAAISSPLRTSRTSPARTGWFQVLPLIAGNRASSVN